MYLVSRLGFKESLVMFCLFCMLVSVLRDVPASGRYTWGEPGPGGRLDQRADCIIMIDVFSAVLFCVLCSYSTLNRSLLRKLRI